MRERDTGEGVARPRGADSSAPAGELRLELERLSRRLLGPAADGTVVDRALAELPESGDAEALRRSALAAVARAGVADLLRVEKPLVEPGDLEPGDLARGALPPLDPALAPALAPRLDAALAGAPRRQAVLLSLRFQAGLDYGEIAALVGARRDQVGILLHRARTALRTGLRGGAKGAP